MIDTYIVQGTTPLFEFEFDPEDGISLDNESLQSLVVTFKQEKGACVEKKITQGINEENIWVEDDILKIQLTQEDTLSFREDKIVEIQLKILNKNGNVSLSDTYYALIQKALNKEVLK